MIDPWLVVLTILKNMKVNGKDDIPYMKWKNKKWLKPPTRIAIFSSLLFFSGIAHSKDIIRYSIQTNHHYVSMGKSKKTLGLTV